MFVSFVKEASGICSFCNPVHLADYECDCVVITMSARRVSVCGQCLADALAALLKGHNTMRRLEPEISGLFSARGNSRG